MSDEDFDLSRSGLRIACPKCGNDLVGDGNTLVLADSPRGAMFECGRCGEITQWKFTLATKEVVQVPVTWGGKC